MTPPSPWGSLASCLPYLYLHPWVHLREPPPHLHGKNSTLRNFSSTSCPASQAVTIETESLIPLPSHLHGDPQPYRSITPGSISTRSLELRESWKESEGDPMLWLQSLSLFLLALKAWRPLCQQRGNYSLSITNYVLGTGLGSSHT